MVDSAFPLRFTKAGRTVLAQSSACVTSLFWYNSCSGRGDELRPKLGTIKSAIVSRNKVSLLLAAACLSVSCGGGGGVGSNSNNPPPNQSISVSVSPASATVAPNGSALFTATVTGTTNTGVTWSASNSQGSNPATVGSISSAGVYTAPATPPNPSTVNITATSVSDTSKSGAATAEILVHHINQDFQSPPIKLGTSGGNATDKTTSNNKVFCCSGTLGALLSRGGNLFVLSNNHVLNKSDQGKPGDPISQPGLADTNCGTRPNTIVANLTQAATLNPSTNVDAAMAQIVSGEVDTTGGILDLSAPGQPAPPSGTLATAAVGQLVAKSGDATGVTCSSVTAIDTRVLVKYQTQCQGGTEFSVTFNNQVAINGGSFSNNGDSGSLIVTTDTARPLALLYAGSSTGTVANPIQDVLSALKDSQSSEVPKIVGTADHPVSCPATPQSQIASEGNSLTSSMLSDTDLANATTAKNLHSTELLRDRAVIDVGIGRSDDNPKEPAILVFTSGQLSKPLPVQVDGVRTKIIHGSGFRALQNTVAQGAPLTSAISESEFARVRAAKELHIESLMSTSGIFGVGVGASKDSLGEGALVIFVEQGRQITIPAEIDGVRTRVIEGEPFRAFNWGTRTVNGCARR